MIDGRGRQRIAFRVGDRYCGVVVVVERVVVPVPVGSVTVVEWVSVLPEMPSL